MIGKILACEFRALENSLTAAEQRALRSLSIRAQITPEHFSYKPFSGSSPATQLTGPGIYADPVQLLERFFDVLLVQFAEGPRLLGFRIPAAKWTKWTIPWQSIAVYAGKSLSISKHDEHALIVFDSRDPLGSPCSELPDLDTLINLREELIQGDFRPLYLGWLAGRQAVQSTQESAEFTEETEGDSVNSALPIPADCDRLTAPQLALVRFLHLTPPPEAEHVLLEQAVRQWIQSLADAEQEKWLLRLIQDETQETRQQILDLALPSGKKKRATDNSISRSEAS